MFDADQYNDEVTDWGKQIPQLLKARALAYGIRHRSNSPSSRPSLAAVGVGYRRTDGLISTVSIRVTRPLIYTHKGAGSGRGGDKGSRWIDAYGNRKKTDGESLGKAGGGGRKAKPFISDVLDGPQGISQLADIVAEGLATTIVKTAIPQ